MGRDYKHKQSRSQGQAPGWVWLAVGLVLGLSATVVLHVRSERQESLKPVPDPNAASQSDSTVADDDDDFTFYDMLPKYEVVIPEVDEAVDVSAPAVAIDEPGVYVLQVGSFKSFPDADRLKAQLALMGLEPSIQRVTIDDGDPWHRVRVGPIGDLDQLNDARDRLIEQGLDPLVIRVGE